MSTLALPVAHTGAQVGPAARDVSLFALYRLRAAYLIMAGGLGVFIWPSVIHHGWLVVRSQFLPRWLGYWLLLDGLAWVFLSVTWFLAPDYTDSLFRYFQPLFMAELAAMLWLLIMGAKEQPLVTTATA